MKNIKKTLFLAFSSLIRAFDFVEDTFARKCSNNFGIFLAYSYLCTGN